MWWSLLCSWGHFNWVSKLKWSVIATVLPHHPQWARKLAPNIVLQPNERDMWELLDELGWLCFTRWLSTRFKISLAGQDWRDLDASVKETNQRNNGYDIKYNNNFSIARQPA